MAEPILKLAIVGASVRAAAFSAVRAGYEVVAADMFADADLKGIVDVTRIVDYPRALPAWLNAIDCDAWLYTGALENYPDVVGLMGTSRPLLGNDAAVLRRARDPLTLGQALAQVGLSFPETRSSRIGLPLDGSWLCKTYRGSSGSGVWRLDGEAAATRAERENAVFQRHVSGEPAAAIFVCGVGRAELFGVTRQLVGVDGANPWQYVGSVGPVDCSPNIMSQLVTLGDLLANEIQLRGLAGVDLILDDDRAWVIEVNPRYSASVEILERATGIAAIRAHIAGCDSKWVDDESRERGVNRTLRLPDQIHAKSILYAPREARISAEFFRWALDRAGLDQATLADIPAAGEVIPAGRPVLTAFAAAGTTVECLERLDMRLAEVKSRLYDENSDDSLILEP